MPVELSIVAGTVNRERHLVTFIESIYKYTDIPFELLLINAGELDVTVNKDNCKIIVERPRIGFAKGYNKAFRQATGKYVVYLNDDVEVTQSWAIDAVRFMDKNSWCGLGALYFSENGKMGPFQIRHWLNLPYANFGIIKRELGEQIGWIDEFLHTYGSDNSLTFKVLLAGYGIGGIPNCKIIHNPIMDKNKSDNMSRQPEDAKNLLMKYRPLLPQMYEVQRKCPGSAEYVT